MPFDVRDFPGALPSERAASTRNRRLIAGWLFTICAMILVMVVLGGVTRLSGSGLSIMQWAPVTGIVPPLSHAAWEKLFALYKSIPQYQLLHAGFGLDGFKRIFWLEWVHRFWGRLLGLAFFAPLVWFWATGRLERRLRPLLALIFLLGGLQGAIGWFMVESGFFPDSTSVSPFRLAIHLALALALYGAILWTALGLIRPATVGMGAAARHVSLLRTALLVFAALLVLTILAGSLVAGTHAGFEYNTFPLMEGRLVPANYAQLVPFVRNLYANLAAVQFDHRLLATLTTAAAMVVVVLGLSRRQPGNVRMTVAALGLLVAMQFGLGVATLLMVVPVRLAAAHQANAVLVLTAALVAINAVRRRQVPHGRPLPAAGPILQSSGPG
ncbi:MAG TPA: COX15/CtaA family protein [Acetobacteraceae bacterium]|nr:COX15/CtaA family protein [Acetobacteraceae bacterium]